MELNKTIQDLKMEVETIKTYGDRKPMKEIIDASITNRIQETEERISGAEDTIVNMDTTIKENAKSKMILTQNIQEIQDTVRRPNLRIIGLEKSEDSKIKGPVNIYNKIIELP